MVLLAAAALAAGFRLEVTLPRTQDNPETLARLIRGIGTIEKRNAEYKTYTVRLNGKVNANEAMRQLQPKVERVRYDDYRYGERKLDRRSRRDVDRKLADAATLPKGEEREEIFESYGMIQHRLERRAYPRDTYDPEAYRTAFKVKSNMPSQGMEDVPAGSWSYLGPRNLENTGGSATTFRVSGRHTAVAFSPTSPDTTFYAGAANGGVWKTTNAGSSWTCLTDDWPHLQVSDIKIDPTNANRIFVATGDAHSEEGYALGMMRSLDGGTTWEEIGEETFTGFQENIIIDPDNTDFITVASEDGFYRSTNGGDTWSKVTSIGQRVLDVDYGDHTSTNNRYYYAASLDGKIYRSTSRGQTWSLVLNNAAYGVIRAVACSPIDDSVVYAICDARKVLRSTDYGQTWSETLTTGFPHHRDSFNNDYKQWSQVDFDYQMECSYRSTLGGPFDVLYVGLFDLSMYASSTWYEIGGTLTLTEANPRIHCDNHDQEIHPTNPNKSLVATDGGVYLVTRNSDNTVDVDNLNSNLYTYELWHMAAGPTNTNQALGGIQHEGTTWSDGPNTEWGMANRGDGAYCVISRTNPLRQFTSIQNYSYDAPLAYITRTYDGWATKESGAIEIGNYAPSFIPPMAGDPSNGNRVYLGGRYLSRWNEGGSTGSTVNVKLGNFLFPDNICAIAVAPTNSNRIYVGCRNGTLFMSSDYGATWVQIDEGALPEAKIECISVSNTVSTNISVAIGGVGINAGHVWRCTSTTATNPVWENRSGSSFYTLPDLPIQTITRDPNTGVWYAGGEAGAFYSDDFGARWYNMTRPWNLPNVEVSWMDAPGNGYLYASTFGRGIWRMPLATSTPTVSSVVLNGSLVVGGNSIDGNVFLTGVAPPGGMAVTMSSSDVNAQVGSTLIVYANDLYRDFTVTTNPVPTDRTVTITATIGSDSNTDTFTLKAPSVSSFSGPTTLVNGNSANYTVNLTGVAPSGGTAVSLSTTNASALPVPSTVTVLEGTNSRTFALTAGTVGTDTNVTLTATRNSLSDTVVVTVLAYDMTALTLSLTTVYSGDALTGRVTVDRAAPAAGVDVTLSATAGTSVPSQVTIPSAQTSANFAVTALLTSVDSPMTVTATLGTRTRTVNRTVLAPVIQSVSVDPSTVSAGTATTGVVVMRGKSGLTPVSVRIRAVRPNGFNITMPSTLTIPLGQNSGAFAINVITAPRLSKVAVYAVHPTGTKNTTFVVQP